MLRTASASGNLHILHDQPVSTGMQVGALFAAQDGIESIPLDWQFRAARFKELEGLTDQLVAQRVIIELM